MDSTVTTKGQVTIPRDVRERLGLQAGDKIAWSLLSNGTVVVWGNNSFGQRNIPSCTSPAKAIALIRSTSSNNGAPPAGLSRKMTIVAAGVAGAISSPLTGWVLISLSMRTNKHGLAKLRSGNLIQRLNLSLPAP